MRTKHFDNHDSLRVKIFFDEKTANQSVETDFVPFGHATASMPKRRAKDASPPTTTTARDERLPPTASNELLTRLGVPLTISARQCSLAVRHDGVLCVVAMPLAGDAPPNSDDVEVLCEFDDAFLARLRAISREIEHAAWRRWLPPPSTHTTVASGATTNNTPLVDATPVVTASFDASASVVDATVTLTPVDDDKTPTSNDHAEQVSQQQTTTSAGTSVSSSSSSSSSSLCSSSVSLSLSFSNCPRDSDRSRVVHELFDYNTAASESDACRARVLPATRHGWMREGKQVGDRERVFLCGVRVC